ncbi:hypothetical protein FISHEDRAFT_39309, partial [Fistulina hepatica ATCC 64428]
AHMHALDSGNSFKWTVHAGTCDPRVFHSNYLISPKIVDQFKDNVKLCPASCESWWKIAQMEMENTMAIFEEIGGFVTLCQHDFIETFVKMVRSGELSKYISASVRKLLNTFDGCQTNRYDIGCKFKETLKASSIAQLIHKHETLTCCNSFHGYAHSHLCQCYEPFSLPPFSRSPNLLLLFPLLPVNGLSPFNKQGLTLGVLGNFINNNYCQTLKIICKYEVQIKKYYKFHLFGENDFQTWFKEELTYLESYTKQFNNEDEQKLAYMKALLALDEAQKLWAHLSIMSSKEYRLEHFVPTGFLPTSIMVEKLVMKKECQHTLKHLELQQNVVEDLEWCLGIFNQ